jgi:hypothetical protein
VDKRAYAHFGLSAIPAAFIGAFLLVYLSQVQGALTFKILNHTISIVPVNAKIEILMILFAFLEFSKRINRISFNKKQLWLGGLLSGFFGAVCGRILLKKVTIQSIR